MSERSRGEGQIFQRRQPHALYRPQGLGWDTDRSVREKGVEANDALASPAVAVGHRKGVLKNLCSLICYRRQPHAGVW